MEVQNQHQFSNNAIEAFQAGNYLEAARLFLRAKESYLFSGDSFRAGEMANDASVSFLMAGDPERAFQVLVGVGGLFEGLGKLHHIAITLGNQAAANEKLGKFSLAINDYKKAGEIFEKIGEYELYSCTMQSLSHLYMRTLKPLNALIAMSCALKFKPQLTPVEHLLKTILNKLFLILNPKIPRRN